jgi:GT2 family glycosyltransferase
MIDRACCHRTEVYVAPRVEVVVLNWNNYADTKECLKSLERLKYPDYGLILVDNGSTDGSAARLEQEFPQHLSIRNDENLGFAGGNNVGIRRALERVPDYILLLNNDTVVSPDLLTQMVKTADEDEKIGLVGGRIYRYGTHDVHHAGGRLTRWKATGRSFRGDRASYDGLRNVSFIIGCLMLMRSTMIYDIGLLDENYFFGGEDVEYCLRAGRAGWKITVNPKATVWHKVSISAGGEGSPFLFYHSTRNRLYFARELGVADRLPFYVFFAVSRLVRLVQWKLSGKNNLIGATLWGIRDFLKGETGKGRY